MTKKQSDKYTMKMDYKPDAKMVSKPAILNMLKTQKYSLEEISEVFQVPVEEIEQIKNPANSNFSIDKSPPRFYTQKQQNIYHFKPMSKRSKQKVLFPVELQVVRLQ